MNVQGVGYFISVSELMKLPSCGEKFSLYIYNYIREDTMDLYGFSSMESRELFKVLLSVSRIGPKAAINILSTMEDKTFINAIINEDVNSLKQVSGIGVKTARRLILELKNKVSELVTPEELTDTGGYGNQLYQALTGLGYSHGEIEKAYQTLKLEADLSLEQKIKAILSYLGKENING